MSIAVLKLWGFDLERIFFENDVKAYITGHEHVSQHHVVRSSSLPFAEEGDEEKQMHHFVVGATSKYGFYGGMSEEIEIDWYDPSKKSAFLEIVFESLDQMKIQFVSQENEIIREVNIPI